MIRPTFLAFETAKRALNTAQAGLDTVGHNVSNANTPGYTRQRVDQVSLSLNGISNKYQTFGAAYTGLGSDIKAISQIRDPYLDNRYRAQAAVNGELSVKNYGLTGINNIFDESASDGLNAKLSELLDALNKLSTKADSPEFARIVSATAEQLTRLLNENANALELERTLQTKDFTTTIANDVNTTLEKIANLNVAIKQDNFYGNPSNDLNDERNMLIDKLSEFLDIKVVRTPVEVSKGNFVENVSIYLNDGSDPPIALVESGFCNKLGVNVDETTGNVSVNLLDGISGFVNKNVGVNGDITANIYEGAIKGYIDIINGVGPIAGGDGVSSFKGIPFYQAALDEFAQKLASVFNNLNNITEGDILNNKTTLYDPTFEKNLFVPLTPKISSYTGANNWIAAFNTGTLGFSGDTPYNITFSYGVHDILDANGNPAYYGDPALAGDTLLDSNNDPVLRADGTAVCHGDPVRYGDPVLDDAGDPLVYGDPALAGDPLLDSNGNPVLYSDGTPILHGDAVLYGGPALDANNNPVTINAEVEINGVTKTYTAKYSATGELNFIAGSDSTDGTGGTVAFSITGNGTVPENGSSIKLDATVTAKNITIAKNWVDNPLYMTATKLDPSAVKKTVLSISGSTPSWLKSVENGSIPVKDGGYQFYYNMSDTTDPACRLCVDIETFNEDGTSAGFKTYSILKSDMKAGTKLALKEDGTGPIGLYITLSTAPTLSSDASKNVVNIKNEPAALNDNILKFVESMSSQNFYSTTGDTGSFHEFMLAFQSHMAEDMSMNEKQLNTSNVLLGSYADRRDAVSAVSVDEEAINMMTYQNYYNAAARYMNVIDEALDKLINGTGIVGR